MLSNMNVISYRTRGSIHKWNLVSLSIMVRLEELGHEHHLLGSMTMQSTCKPKQNPLIWGISNILIHGHHYKSFYIKNGLQNLNHCQRRKRDSMPWTIFEPTHVIFVRAILRLLSGISIPWVDSMHCKWALMLRHAIQEKL